MITPEIFMKAIFLPPKLAIEYIKEKDPTITMTAKEFQDFTDVARKEAFTVANVAKLDLLQDVQDLLVKAAKLGTGFPDFKANLIDLMTKKGWILNQDGSRATAFRMETIYRTNLHSAYNAGRITQQKQVLNTRPYWRYNSVVDPSTTQGCNLLNGRVARADDPFWMNNYPPRHYRCRGSVTSLSQREIDRDGLDVGIPPELSDTQPAKGFGGQPDAGFSPDLSQYDKKLAKQYSKAVK